MKILNFINSPDLNQLRPNMRATLVKKIDCSFLPKPLVAILLHERASKKFPAITKPKENKKILKNLNSSNHSTHYSKDDLNPKKFHSVENNKK